MLPLALLTLRCSLEDLLRRECETFSLAYSSETSCHSFVLGSNKTNRPSPRSLSTSSQVILVFSSRRLEF